MLFSDQRIAQSIILVVVFYQSVRQWIAFLDDDDTWTACDHLSATRQMLESAGDGVELCLADQVAHESDGTTRRLWLYPLF